MKQPSRAPRPSAGLSRVLSKYGACSRSEARVLISAGRVKVNGVAARDPEQSVPSGARIELDGKVIAARDEVVYVMLNKPRGLVTTSSDERGRDTVFSCLEGSNLPRLIAVGRLDQASEGILLLTNDTAWANHITDPATHLDKTYHAQVDQVVDDELLKRLLAGVSCDDEILRAKAAHVLRSGEKHSWLEIVLDERRNRHIRRMFEALGISVLRLVRISVGKIPLGNLPKGEWRRLTTDEAEALRKTAGR